MVQVRAQQPVNQDGSINLEAWLDYVQSLDPALQREGLRQACEFARDTEAAARAAQNIWKDGVSSYRTGLQIAEILADLKLDQDSLVAAIIYRAVREGKTSLVEVEKRFGAVVSKLIDGRCCPSPWRCWLWRLWRWCSVAGGVTRRRIPSPPTPIRSWWHGHAPCRVPATVRRREP